MSCKVQGFFLVLLIRIDEIAMEIKLNQQGMLKSSQSTRLVFLLFFLASSRFGMAQEDVVFLKNADKKIGLITAVSQSKVEYQPGADATVEKIDKDQIELVLFGNSSFLVFPNDYKGVDGPMENRHKEDWILTKDEQIVVCSIENGASDPMSVFIPGDSSRKTYQVPKSSVNALLFGNGNRQFLGNSASLIAGILRKRQMKNSAEFLAQFEVKKETPKRNNNGSIGLDEASVEQFKVKSLQKIEELRMYLNGIANKSTEQAVAEKMVKQAVDLFIHDTVIVETTRPNGERKQEFVRNYLTKLRMLKYSSVKIEWSETQYISQIKKAPDGNYYGVVSFIQKFTADLPDSKNVFEDVTRKNIEVILKSYKKEVDGESLELWDVFLGNIGISASKG
jgi:hypothetical protein